MSTILVTGGAGYIGSHVVKGLRLQGHQLIIYDNLQTGHRKAVKDGLFIQGDLANEEKLKETFYSNPISAIMHFAADCLVSESMKSPLKYFNNNVINSLQLLEIAEEFNIDNFVFSSSATVYGEPESIPILETHPCVPVNFYGETKWIFERVLQSRHHLKKINYISLRYFNAAGADPEGKLGEDHSPETHLIPLVLKAALGGDSIPIYGTDYNTPDGTCIRDYIHVEDLAQAHILALDRLENGGTSEIYNLGNGNGYSVKEVIDTARRVTGKMIFSTERSRRPGDPARLVASSEKIRKQLGWSPKYPDLEMMIETAWRWHQNHPHGYGDKY